MFDNLSEEEQKKIMGDAKRTVVAEAGCRQGWEGYAKKADIFTINRFGESGPAAKVAEFFNFTPAGLAEVLKK